MSQYGSVTLKRALADLLVDSPEHLIPAALAEKVAAHAL